MNGSLVPPLPEVPASLWLSRYRWYRRWRRGHWEQWCFGWDCWHFHIWICVLACTEGTYFRPLGPARGVVGCEDWGW